MNPYVTPIPPPPAKLTLTQFLQTVLVGVSGFDGTLVRPIWQKEPPKSPDIDVDWISFGIQSQTPDAMAYVGTNQAGQVTTVRHEALEIAIQIYGPNCVENYGLLRDGFQLDQNRIAIQQAKMGFTELTAGRHIPDLVNQRWVDRVVCSLLLRREIQRSYPVLTFVSASGTIYVPDAAIGYEQTFTVTE